MHFNPTTPLKTIKGDELKDPEGKPVTMGEIAVQALLATHVDDNGRAENPSGEEKMRRYMLAMKIEGATLPVDIKAEDVAKLKELVGKAFNPLVVGQFYENVERPAPAAVAAE